MKYLLIIVCFVLFLITCAFFYTAFDLHKKMKNSSGCEAHILSLNIYAFLKKSLICFILFCVSVLLYFYYF